MHFRFTLHNITLFIYKTINSTTHKKKKCICRSSAPTLYHNRTARRQQLTTACIRQRWRWATHNQNKNSWNAHPWIGRVLCFCGILCVYIMRFKTVFCDAVVVVVIIIIIIMVLVSVQVSGPLVSTSSSARRRRRRRRLLLVLRTDYATRTATSDHISRRRCG